MAEIINFNRARKAKAKADAARQAKSNRSAGSRSKAEKEAAKRSVELEKRELDGKKLED